MKPFILLAADKLWAIPSGRALAYGQALLHGLGGSAASIAIAVFCAVYFSLQLMRGVL